MGEEKARIPAEVVNNFFEKAKQQFGSGRVERSGERGVKIKHSDASRHNEIAEFARTFVEGLTQKDIVHVAGDASLPPTKLNHSIIEFHYRD